MKAKEAQLVAAARDALVKVASERDDLLKDRNNLREKLAAFELRLVCEKTAAQMHEKGINADREFAELVEDLEKAAMNGRLPAIQEAVAMSAPDMGSKIASINYDHDASAGVSQLEQYLIGSVG